MSSSPCKFFLVFYTVFSIFGFTNQNNILSRVLNSHQQEVYGQLPERARAEWLLGVMANLKDDMSNLKDELAAEKANSIFAKFICAMTLLRLQCDDFISAATDRKKFRMTDIDCTSKQIPDNEKSLMKNVIQRIVGMGSDSVRNDAYKLSEAFYWAVKDSNSDASKYLRGNLTQKNYGIWECVAVTAAFRKLCNYYMHKNGSEAVKIYTSYLAVGLVKDFFEIIRDYNTWSVTTRDLDIINVVLRSLLSKGTIQYREIKIGDTRLGLPIQDTATSLTTCLSVL